MKLLDNYFKLQKETELYPNIRLKKGGNYG